MLFYQDFWYLTRDAIYVPPTPTPVTEGPDQIRNSRLRTRESGLGS